jgi:hypothetical protein
MRVSVKRVLSGCALVMAFVPGVTFAAEVDESAGPRLEEVTVTATRHEEAMVKTRMFHGRRKLRHTLPMSAGSETQSGGRLRYGR